MAELNYEDWYRISIGEPAAKCREENKELIQQYYAKYKDPISYKNVKRLPAVPGRMRTKIKNVQRDNYAKNWSKLY